MQCQGPIFGTRGKNPHDLEGPTIGREKSQRRDCGRQRPPSVKVFGRCVSMFPDQEANGDRRRDISRYHQEGESIQG